MVCVWGEWEEFREWKRSKEWFEVGARRRAIGLAERVRVEGCVLVCESTVVVKVVKVTCQREVVNGLVKVNDNPPNLMGHRVRTGDGMVGASLRRVAIGGSNVHQPCFPPQVLSG